MDDTTYSSGRPYEDGEIDGLLEEVAASIEYEAPDTTVSPSLENQVKQTVCHQIPTRPAAMATTVPSSVNNSPFSSTRNEVVHNAGTAHNSGTTRNVVVNDVQRAPTQQGRLYTSELSMTCQKRWGFNPLFSTWQRKGDRAWAARVTLLNQTIHALAGYAEESKAKQEAARLGLEWLNTHPSFPRSTDYDGYNQANSGVVTAITGRSVSQHPTSQSSASVANRIGVLAGHALPQRPSVSTSIEVVPGNTMRLVHNLPGNIRASQAQDLLSNAMHIVNNGTANITFNLPGNTTPEVAAAYGHAMHGLLSSSSGHGRGRGGQCDETEDRGRSGGGRTRNRLRSRSPAKEPERRRGGDLYTGSAYVNSYRASDRWAPCAASPGKCATVKLPNDGRLKYED